MWQKKSPCAGGKKNPRVLVGSQVGRAGADCSSLEKNSLSINPRPKWQRKALDLTVDGPELPRFLESCGSRYIFHSGIGVCVSNVLHTELQLAVMSKTKTSKEETILPKGFCQTYIVCPWPTHAVFAVNWTNDWKNLDIAQPKPSHPKDEICISFWLIRKLC